MPSDMPSEEDDELEISASEDDGADDDLGADAEVVDAVDEIEDDEDERAPKRKVAVAPAAVEDVANVEARRQVREKLETDVEAFLRKGGQIVEVADDVRADPPKKPESKYGTRSI